LKALIQKIQKTAVQNGEDLEILRKVSDAVKNKDDKYLEISIPKVRRIKEKYLNRASGNTRENLNLFSKDEIPRNDNGTFRYDRGSMELELESLIQIIQKTVVQKGDDLGILRKFSDAVKNNDYKYIQDYILKVRKIKGKYLYWAMKNTHENLDLFCWDEIPGNDNGRLVEFLEHTYGTDWVKTAKIEKTEGGRKIIVSSEKNSLSLRLNDKKNRVKLTIDDVKTEGLDARIEDGKRNVSENFIKRILDFDLEELEGYLKYENIYNLGLFSWDEIPGNDNVRLVEFLGQTYGTDWVKTAKIEKTEGGRKIIVSGEKNSLSLRLNDKKTRVNLTIDDVKTDELTARPKNGELNIYKYNKTEYSEPRIYKAFDLAKSGTKIVLLHAGFDQILFVDLLKRYNKEFGNSNLIYSIYTSEVKNKKTKCYQITEKGFWKRTFDKYYKKEVEGFLIKLRRIYYKSDIYIITYKDHCIANLTNPELIERVDQTNPEYTELAYGFDSMHFGSTPGLNRFENKDVLVIIGTYSLNPEDKIKKYNELYNENLEPKPYIDKAERIINEGKYGEIIEDEFLFSWEDIQGDDGKKLTDLLKSRYDLEWLKEAKIAKTNSDKTIIGLRPQSGQQVKLWFTVREKYG